MISGRVESSNQIRAVFLSVNGQSPENIGSSQFSVMKSFSTPGMKILSIYAIDSAQNESQKYSFLVQITNSATVQYHPGDIIINEVGSTYNTGVSSWFEVYNPGIFPVDLSQLMIASCYYVQANPSEIFLSRQYFNVPATNLNPGQYMLIRSKIDEKNQDGPSVVHISKEQFIPFWTSRGFIEVLSVARTIDFVSFGSQSEQPQTGTWNGAAPPLSYEAIGYGRSIARDVTHSDTDSGTDWHLRLWSTPGGINDITNDADTDYDGIPDQAEMPGGTFAGLPLYNWGARLGKKDIFLHIDYMNSLDSGVTPRKEALEKVKVAFSNQNIALHIDCGDLYHGGGGISPEDFDLDDVSHQVPFSAGVILGDYPGLANLYNYKAMYMDIRRKQIFHYCLFAYSQYNSGPGGSTGVAEIDGNDLIVSLGNNSLSESPQSELNKLINFQAATLMHEFGHNLGLRHGGFEDQNYKPNYYSIMNYEYQLWGLPHTNSLDEGDRYYFRNNYLQFTLMHNNYNLLDRGPTNSNMLIDYSHGNGGDLSEFSLTESAGLRQAWSQGVDWNGDGDMNDSLSRDINGDGFKSLLSDSDDWNNINLFFMHYVQGDNQGIYLHNHKVSSLDRLDYIQEDRQNIIFETLKIPEQE